MFQALPTDEIILCDSNNYARLDNNIGYICTTDVKHKKDTEQKTKKSPFFLEKAEANGENFTIYKKENKSYKPNEKLMLKLTDK